jgi:very-short-patch-repair endonuclease
LGCGCQNKTEKKLRQWLEKKYPGATIDKQYRGPKTDKNGQTHFDFHLTFSDGFEVLIELDGPQHFLCDTHHFSNGTCERDLLKEEWAISKGLSVVRVLQEDVWNDRLGWDRYVTDKIEAARLGEPRVFTLDAPEYQSTDSAYVQLRLPTPDKAFYTF